MKKLLILALLLITVTIFPLAGSAKAEIQSGQACAGTNPHTGLPNNPTNDKCAPGLLCKPSTAIPPTRDFFICTPMNAVEQVLGVINPPEFISNLGFGSLGIGNVLTKILLLIYIIASLIFIFMVVMSALQWIASGGDKEALSKARGRLTHAIIGITLLALSFMIIKTLGDFLGFKFF